jgi:flagellar biosynthetic protein FliQ
MNTDVALFWMQESLKTAVLLTAPLLGVALVVGLIVSLFQAITSIQEMTLSYIPKMAAVGLILLLLAPWMLEMLSDFTIHVLTFIPNVSR